MVELARDLFERKRKASAQPVQPQPQPTGADEALAAAKKHEVDINQVATDGTRWKGVVTAYIINFNDWKLVDTVSLAISTRSTGSQVLTHREADILCLRGLEPDSVKSLLVNNFGNILTEGEYDDVADIFGLRIRYNNGLIWRKTKSTAAASDARERGEAMINLILTQIDKLLPSYEFEHLAGFAPELLKPEWATNNELMAKIARIGSGK